MSFENVTKLENKLAEFFGAPYAICLDACTHGIELCLRYQKIETIIVPKRTYISVPFLANKFGKKNGALVLFAVSLTVENGIIVLRLLGLLPENGSPIVLAGVLVFHFIGVATSVISFTTLNSMVWDTVEEVEIKTGRSESIKTRLEALLIKSDLSNFSFSVLK